MILPGRVRTTLVLLVIVTLVVVSLSVVFFGEPLPQPPSSLF
jgi:hypothetical protein